MRSALAHLPIEVQVWTGDDCAEYLGQESSTFLKKTRYLPGFPDQLEIPGRPRWPAKEVIAWALRRMAKNPK